MSEKVEFTCRVSMSLLFPVTLINRLKILEVFFDGENNAQTHIHTRNLYQSSGYLAVCAVNKPIALPS